MAKQWRSAFEEEGRSQRELNQSFPPNARTIRDQPNPIDVEARVVWEVDGEEWVRGTARRWTQRHVSVTLNDRRCLPSGFWFDPSDVRRLQVDRP